MHTDEDIRSAVDELADEADGIDLTRLESVVLGRVRSRHPARRCRFAMFTIAPVAGLSTNAVSDGRACSGFQSRYLYDSSEGWIGTATVYAPGAFDTALLSNARRVSGHGISGFAVQLPGGSVNTPCIRTSGNQTSSARCQRARFGRLAPREPGRSGAASIKPIVAHALPCDCDRMYLRPASPGDELVVADIHVRSWQEAYAKLLPAQLLNALDPAQRAARYTFDDENRVTILAVEEDRVCGFATIGPARDSDAASCGELMSIYLDPASLGRGIGRMLIAGARARLSARAFPDAVLWVMVGNERAMRFYERDGWRPDGSQRRIDVQGVVVSEVRYRRPLTDSQN